MVPPFPPPDHKSVSAANDSGVLGAWQPYAEVIDNGLTRACRAGSVTFTLKDTAPTQGVVPTWDPNSDVPAGVEKAWRDILLAIL